MKYKGEKCFYCNEDFNDNDDVVVCPECGTPYHRDCYKQAGSCINHQLHESGEIWKSTQDKAEINNPDKDSEITDIKSSDEKTQEEAFQTDNGILKFDLSKPFFGLDPDEDFDGARMSEIFAFVRTNTM